MCSCHSILECCVTFSGVKLSIRLFVLLQHFNRNHLVDSNYVQFNIEHTDFTDYIYSSRNVKYSELNHAVLVGGVTNWLNNLAQSNRQMDINHDWSLGLQVSSTTNVHKGFGDPTMVDMDGDFLPEVVLEGGGQLHSVAIPSLTERFHPDALPDNREEECALFGDITDNDDDDTEEDSPSDDDDNYFDKDNSMCEVLQNEAALDVFLTNELASLPPSVMRDYYELGEVQNTILRGECLLISLCVHHLFITQPKNFRRIMKKSNWLTDIMIGKLQTISRGVSLRFGDNLKGRGHWEEIELMRRSFPHGGGCSINVNKPTIKSSVLSMRRRNCNEEPTTFPVFVLKYEDHDKSKGSRIIKLFSCGDIGIFSNDKPCILLLRNGHFYNVWKYEWLFLNMDSPKIRGK